MRSQKTVKAVEEFRSGRRLKLGLCLPTWSRDVGVSGWPQILEMAELAEQIGFDSLWLVDHLLYPSAEIRRRTGAEVSEEILHQKQNGVWECWALLAAVAARVPRVDLGTLVTCTSYRNPGLLAKMAETVDEISGGRLILGLGAGDSETEHRTFGYAYDHPVSRFEEAVFIIRNLLRNGYLDFQGSYYQVRECELRPRGPQVSGAPILIGTMRPKGRMLRIVAQYADLWNGWLVYGDSTATAVPPLRQAVDAACEENGRAPSSLTRSVAVRVALLGTEVPGSEPIRGSAAHVAEALLAHSREGIMHVQVLLTPSSLKGIEAFGKVIQILRSV